MANVLVSILVVSYNAEKYIKKTLASCLNQTYKNLEVLLLDNASKDGTVNIAESLQKNDSRLKIFKSGKNVGPYAGLNLLLDKAEGEYMAIQDHDDVWFPEKITKQVDFLEKNKNFIACGTNTFYFYESVKLLILNKKPEVTEFVDHTSLMFRNKGLRYNPKHSLADEYFEKKVLAKSGNIACVQDVLTVHRIKSDGTNLSSNRISLNIKNFRDFFAVNKFSLRSLSYMLDVAFGRFIPEKILWLLRKKITQKNKQWIRLEEFSRTYPYICL